MTDWLVVVLSMGWNTFTAVVTRSRKTDKWIIHLDYMIEEDRESQSERKGECEGKGQ